MPGEAILSRVDLFAALSPQERAQLATVLHRRRFPKGAVLFLRGDPGSSLCIVEEGWVKLVLTSDDGKEFTLDLFGPGDCFGELALLDVAPRSTDAIAHEDCSVLLLPKADFDHFLDSHPRAARILLAVLARRLRRDAILLHEAIFDGLPDRLARALLRMADQLGDAREAVRVLPVTQDELASSLGVTRESVNKWLGYFERRGVLQRQRGQIRLLQLDALKRSE
jgi:CRP-like cAMP-binding protein